MKSKWFDLKPKARKMRKKGNSLRSIEEELGIPRSTLSGWFKGLELTKAQKERLKKNKLRALERAREKAKSWHRNEKRKRIKKLHNEADKVLNDIDSSDGSIHELALALLYLGEGSKSDKETSLSSTSPDILRFFIFGLKKLYNVRTEDFNCDLRLRMDQDKDKETDYWMNELDFPRKNFSKVYYDKRTTGSKTYPDYHGACHVRIWKVAIQRRLLYLGEEYCRMMSRLH